MKEIKPALAAGLFEMELPLGAAPGRDELLRVIEDVKAKGSDAPSGDKARGLWAEEQLSLIDRGFGLASAAPVLVQGISLGRGLRLVAVEGELTADLGNLIHDFYADGITFPLGYSNGARMYLPSSRMIDEGGYEVESFWEYRQPAPLVKGVEAHYTDALDMLKKAGIQ
ncbi:MAG: hypothetical protein A2W03_16995 [Candidatus Aminicenantes bacterium RBG_16_63_16]|nr:MAG: hypothetical protein A2W03_16995 [Candidatus Aminicenantes bacterium RBG_16_63_16]